MAQYKPRSKQVKQKQHSNSWSGDKRSSKFYSSVAWQKKRKYIIQRDKGLCQHCLQQGITTIGNEVDHIISTFTNWELRLTDSNLQLLCKRCHIKKTHHSEK